METKTLTKNDFTNNLAVIGIMPSLFEEEFEQVKENYLKMKNKE